MKSHNNSNPDVLCFGGLDWWYHNRGHFDMQLMRRFAKNATVLYVNSLVIQRPNLSDVKKFLTKFVRKSKSIFTGLRKTEAGFWVYSPFAMPVHHINWVKPINNMLLSFQLWCVMRGLHMTDPLVWVACPVACDVALKLRKSKLVYQRTDRTEKFPGVDVEKSKAYDRKLKDHADLTLFVNKTLYEQEVGQCRRAIYLDHGVDFEMFNAAAGGNSVPADMPATEKPVVGFFGSIDDHTFDMSFAEKVVDLLPDFSFVFVGAASLDTSALKSRKNVCLLGQKPYEKIPHYGKCFDVAIMPWRQNQWIKACNPVKLKEYLALGKPVVSTPFPELKKYPGKVYQATTPQDFAQAVKKALAQDNPHLAAMRRQMVQHDSWDAKAQIAMNALLDQQEPPLEGIPLYNKNL